MVKQELDQYLLHPQLPMEESPLEWWMHKHSRHPWLAKVAGKYLCVCATSVQSERVFSCAGHIVSDHRSSLKPDKVDALVFLARNLKNSFCIYMHAFLVYIACKNRRTLRTIVIFSYIKWDDISWD